MKKKLIPLSLLFSLKSLANPVVIIGLVIGGEILAIGIALGIYHFINPRIKTQGISLPAKATEPKDPNIQLASAEPFSISREGHLLKVSIPALSMLEVSYDLSHWQEYQFYSQQSYLYVEATQSAVFFRVKDTKATE